MSFWMWRAKPPASSNKTTTTPPIMMSIRFVMYSLQISYSRFVVSTGPSGRPWTQDVSGQRVAVGALAAEATASGAFHQPPPRAWNSAAVSVKRAARACTSAMRVDRYVRCASSDER